MALADQVKQLRDEHGCSPGELAERGGADPAQISRYENGRITPSADALVLIFIDALVTETRLKALAGGVS